MAAALALSTLGFAVLAARSQRFIEYLPVFAVASLATALPSTFGERGPAWPRRLGLALTALGLLTTGTLGSETVALTTRVLAPIPAPAAAQLQRLIPPAEQVFTCGWEETGHLMVALPERRFMVALDPNYFWKADPAKYRQWYELTHLRTPRPVAQTVQSDFGARWVYCAHEDRYAGFLASLEHDPRARPVLRTRSGSVYQLLDRDLPRGALKVLEEPR
ncbi:MAG: hypothetical protein QM765_40645 [Myxococcales bacterium]